MWLGAGRHALGACGGTPDGPGNALKPEFVPTRTSPSAADGAAKCGTPLGMLIGNPGSVAPVALFSAYSCPLLESTDQSAPPARSGGPDAPVPGPGPPGLTPRGPGAVFPSWIPASHGT